MLKYTLAIILFFALLSCSIGFSNPRQLGNDALEELVQAERSFARNAMENGIRDSFIAFFADDGINFQPHPTNTKESMLNRPPAKRPLAVTLNWEPTYADISRAGDLGYTTGPYTLKDNSPQPKPTNYGYYFSIWKRQKDKSWKVEVDCGISTPWPERDATPPYHAAIPGQFVSKAPIKLDVERQKLIEVEQTFSANAATKKLSAAYTAVLDNDARLHRNDIMPLTEAKAIFSLLDKQALSMSWTPLRADVAASADIGYTYGRYESKDVSTGKTVESGASVWSRRHTIVIEEKCVTMTEENEIRTVVRDELIGILQDAKTQLGTSKDPTGIGRKALEGLVNLIRARGSEPAKGNTGED